MSEPQLDTKTKTEVVSATLVVLAEPEPETENVASPSIEDPESATPQTSNEKLKSLDKKTFLFAGYVFWGMIFISGGATAAVLLSRKKPDPTTTPTTAPSAASALSEYSNPAPSSSTCPVKKPEPGDLCFDLDLVCDYEYRNTSCEEGGLLCYPTEHFHCTSIGNDQIEWNLSAPDFFCEGDIYPSTFLDPCTPIEPSAAPTVAPTFTAAPTFGVCSHNDVVNKLNSVFGGGKCFYSKTYPTENPNVFRIQYVCDESVGDFGENGFYSASVTYEFLHLLEGDFNVPDIFRGLLQYRNSTPTRVDFEPFRKNIAFNFTKGDPCNFYAADELFEMIRGARPPRGPCSHQEIIDKLYSVFGSENCERVSPFTWGCNLQNNLGTNGRADYSISLNKDNQEEPKSVEISYSDSGTTPTVVELQFSNDDCSFDAATSIIFDTIAAAFDKCPKEEPDNDSTCSDPDLTCNYEYIDASCDQFVSVCIPMKTFRCNGSRWSVTMPGLAPCPIIYQPGLAPSSTNLPTMYPCIP